MSTFTVAVAVAVVGVYGGIDWVVAVGNCGGGIYYFENVRKVIVLTEVCRMCLITSVSVCFRI